METIKKIDIHDTKEWKNENGELHREDGPAVMFPDGTKSWWINGKLHREDGPAVMFNDGTKAWYLNGKIHREDGPAVIYSSGIKEYWLNDKKYTEKEYQEEVHKRKL